MKLDKRYLIRELNDEIKRVSNMRKLIEDEDYNGKELTPHKWNEIVKTTDKMIKNYLLHILQFGTPQERVMILKGIESKFELKQRKLLIL